MRVTQIQRSIGTTVRAFWRWLLRTLSRLPMAIKWCVLHDSRIPAIVHYADTDRSEATSLVARKRHNMLYEDASGVLWWRQTFELRQHVPLTTDASGRVYPSFPGGEQMMLVPGTSRTFYTEHETNWSAMLTDQNNRFLNPPLTRQR